MIALAVQMANNVIDAVCARAMGSLTSISDVSDPYFVRSYHSLLVLPIKARESNHTYHREISLSWSASEEERLSPTAGDDENREWRNGYAT